MINSFQVYEHIQSHFQELKNTLRWLMQGEAWQWTLPSELQVLMLKETLGPFTELESTFNPMAVLLGAGVPAEKLYLLVCGREPLQTWASWDEWWGDRTCVDFFILAYETTEQIRRQAQEMGIPSTCLIYEAFKDRSAKIVFKKLFRRLDLPFSPLAIQGWDRLPAFGDHGSNIILPKEPDQFITADIHTPVKKSQKFVYCSRHGDLANLKKSDVAKIFRNSLPNIYERWKKIHEDCIG
jgi:hypothetical protein